MKSLAAAFLVLMGAASASASAFTVSDLMGLLDRPGTDSLEKLVPSLPEALLENHTYMVQSKSRQTGTRAILFRVPEGDKPSEIVALAFKPAVAAPSKQTLEVMAFNPAPRGQETTLELYEVTFPLGRGIDGKVARPEKNPSTCVRCHTENPRPIWGNYPSWPGAMGANDDMVGDGQVSTLRSLQSSVLGRLLHPPEGSLLTPYEPPHSEFGVENFRPNLRLSELVARLGARRLVGMLRRHELFPKYGSLLALSSLYCFTDERVNKGELPAMWKVVGEDLGIAPEGDSQLKLDLLEAFDLVRADVMLLSERRVPAEETISNFNWYSDGQTSLEKLFNDRLVDALASDIPDVDFLRSRLTGKLDAWDYWSYDGLNRLARSLSGGATPETCQRLWERTKRDLSR